MKISLKELHKLQQFYQKKLDHKDQIIKKISNMLEQQRPEEATIKMPESVNILFGQGKINKEQGKENWTTTGEFLEFDTSLDFSKPIKVSSINGDEITISQYSRDLADFICYWSNNILVDLSVLPKFKDVQFEFVNFKLIPD